MHEGIACRELNPTLPVVILSGVYEPSALDLCAYHRLQPVVSTAAHLQWLEQYRGEPLSLWLKIDTGMNRLGIATHEVADAIARLQRNQRLSSIRLMSHLANADDGEDSCSERQLRLFKECTESYQMERSLANSAGVMQWRQTHFDWVRPGIMLYGGTPLLGSYGEQLGLRPVMNLQSRLLSVKDIERGQAVGYGGTFVAPAAMRIGVVGFGYGDGYPRVVNAQAAALLCGVRVRCSGACLWI